MMCSKQFLIVPLLTLIVSAKAQQVSEVDALVSTSSVLNAWNIALLKKDAHDTAAFFTEDANSPRYPARHCHWARRHRKVLRCGLQGLHPEFWFRQSGGDLA